MASASPSALVLLALASCLFLITPKIQAQSASAPAPAPPGPLNLTGILDKNGQFTTLIRLLTTTQVANQIVNQLNNSNDGMTVFAPTDNAFSNLKPGTLNGLTDQQQVQLVLYHVLPKYYRLGDLQTVSNPVRTQASGQDGRVFGLNITSAANQVNISTGMVDTQVNNALRTDRPLAVYQVDKVLLPVEFSEAKPPVSVPSPKEAPSSTSKKAPASSSRPENNNSGSNARTAWLGLTLGIGLVFIWVL